MTSRKMLNSLIERLINNLGSDAVDIERGENIARAFAIINFNNIKIHIGIWPLSMPASSRKIDVFVSDLVSNSVPFADLYDAKVSSTDINHHAMIIANQIKKYVMINIIEK